MRPGINTHGFSITTPEDWTPDKVEQYVRQQFGDDVIVAPNLLMATHATAPNDTNFGSQWYLEQANDHDIDATAAWDLSKGHVGTSNSGGSLVAVIDTGFDTSHPDLNGNFWSNPNDPIDGIDNDGNGWIDDYQGNNFIDLSNDISNDTRLHGTAVAGVIAAETNNSYLVSGIGWNTKIIGLRTGYLYLGKEYLDTNAMINSINYVVDLKQNRGVNINIINISAQLPDKDDVPEFNDAVNAALAAGILIVVTAGNGSGSVEGTSLSEYTQDNIIVVGAVDSTDTRVYGYGSTTVDIAAPGFGILCLKAGGGTEFQNGTSLAAPLVSGVAALISAARPDLNYTYIRSAILNGADAVVTPTNQIAGNRRLNAYGALIQAGVTSFKGNPVVEGTTSADTILVEPNGANVRVRVNGSTVFDRPASEVTGVSIAGLGGHDAVTVSNSLNIRAFLYGGAGNDTLTGGAGADVIVGGQDQDVLKGSDNKDSLIGGLGDDSLEGGAGNDTLDGGRGNDTLQGDSGGDAAWYTSLDADSKLLFALGYQGPWLGITVDIDDVADDVADSAFVPDHGTYVGGTDNIETTVEHIYGTSGEDSITGNPNVGGYLRGGGSNDFISGSVANDTIYGGSGNDTIFGANGADAIRGENGNDSLYAYVSSNYNDGDIDTLKGGAGTDLAFYVAGQDIWETDGV